MAICDSAATSPRRRRRRLSIKKDRKEGVLCDRENVVVQTAKISSFKIVQMDYIRARYGSDLARHHLSQVS